MGAVPKAFPGENWLGELHGFFGEAMLFAVLAYGAWEWQQPPKGLVSAQVLSSLTTGDHRGSGGHDGDDD